MNRTWKVLVVLACAACIATPAFADVKAFNAAVKAGDYKTAAAEAETTWKTWDTSSGQTALLAREFGFAALIAGRNDLARQFGQFLVEKGASLATPDDQPLTSAVLFRIADFRIGKSDTQRSALRDALFARSGAPGLDITAVVSWEALYVADWNGGDWDNAAKDAAGAAEFMSRDAKNMLVRQRSAELQAASAMFVGGRNRVTKGKNDYYDAMANVHDRIVGDIDAAAGQAARDQLWPMKWRSEAWAIAIESYLTSSYEQVGSNISSALNARPLLQPKFAQYPEDPASAQLPACGGEFEGKKLRYPENKAYKGLVGSVIVRLETGADGKVTDVEVLAAVPGEGFAAKMIETLETWTFKPNAANAGACRLNSRNRNYKVSFRIM